MGNPDYDLIYLLPYWPVTIFTRPLRPPLLICWWCRDASAKAVGLDEYAKLLDDAEKRNSRRNTL